MASHGGLSEYRAKRNFSRTPEPKGREAQKQGWRFGIQKHAATRLHYDFRLELDGVLKSWAVTRGPSLDPADKRLAVEVEDHPLDYGDFEGTIPKGQYGGGTVMLWDRGTWEPEGDPDKMLAKGDLKFSLDGEKLHGSWVLVRMKGDRFGGKRTNWLLIKHHDAYSHEGDHDVLLAEARSVASGRDMDSIAEGRGRGPKPFVTLAARTAPALPVGIYDGEACALDASGAPDFPALLAALSDGDTDDLVYFVFDALFAGGEDLRPLPLSERKARLKALCEQLPKAAGQRIR